MIKMMFCFLPFLFVFSCSSFILKPDKTESINIGFQYTSIAEIQKLPKSALKVRIFIESYKIFIEDKVSITPVLFDCRDIEDVAKDVLFFLKTFEKINLSLEIKSIEFIDPQQHMIFEPSDLNPYKKISAKINDPDELNIYYVYAHGGFPNFCGFSEFPWNKGNCIFIIGRLATEYTLSHEIGHYLGLYHTFSETGDQVDDTPDFNPPISIYKDNFRDIIGNPQHDPNFNNLMSYSTSENQALTDGQFQRAYYFLYNYRKNQTIKPSETYSLDTVITSAKDNRSRMISMQIIRSLFINWGDTTRDYSKNSPFAPM